MSPWLTLLEGDCIEKLKTLPAKSVQCCVTSPPYFGLRDYGHKEQIGLEETPVQYVAKLVQVFGEVWNVLRDDGTLWLNLGDSYAGSGMTGGIDGIDGGKNRVARMFVNPKVRQQSRIGSKLGDPGHTSGKSPPKGWKSKDMMGIPWRVAFALQDAGWYLRSEIIWAKPNPMPESVTDRCTKSHEHIFMLTKRPRYYFNAGAICEPTDPENGRDTSCARRDVPPGQKTDTGFIHGRRFETRNKRDVWTVPSSPYKDAHFATFPPDLIKPCVLAGTKAGDVVLDPFGGSGTTGMVAIELGRKAVLCELNPKYCDLIRQRCSTTPGLPL